MIQEAGFFCGLPARHQVRFCPGHGSAVAWQHGQPSRLAVPSWLAKSHVYLSLPFCLIVMARSMQVRSLGWPGCTSHMSSR